MTFQLSSCFAEWPERRAQVVLRLAEANVVGMLAPLESSLSL